MESRSKEAKERARARDERFRKRQDVLDKMTAEEYATFADEEAQRLDHEANDMIRQRGLSPRTAAQTRGIVWSAEDRARMGMATDKEASDGLPMAA